MEIWLSVWKSCGISMKFPRCAVSMVFTVLTAVKVFVNVCVMMLHNTHSTRMLLCLLAADAAEGAAKWLLSSAAREIHTFTMAHYVITGQGCAAAGSQTVSLAWVLAWVSTFPPLFPKCSKKSPNVR